MDPFRSWYQTQAPVRRPFSRSPNSIFAVPAHHVDPHSENLHQARKFQRPPAEEKPTQKVVRIPVQFLGSKSDSNRREESALKIQKLYRGFLVRNSLRKVRDIKSMVDEIEANLRRSEVVEKIKRDKKERLRMNENLMNLLFKLDEIRGIDLGVRNCRKGVTKKAIALQEKVDSIAAIDSESVDFGTADIQNQDSETSEPQLADLGSSVGMETSAYSAQNVGEIGEEIVDASSVVEAELDEVEIAGEPVEEIQANDAIDAEACDVSKIIKNEDIEEREWVVVNGDGNVKEVEDDSMEGLNQNGVILCDSSVKDKAMEDASKAYGVEIETASEENSGEETRANISLPCEIMKEPEFQKIGAMLEPEHKEREAIGRSNDCELLKNMIVENAKMMRMMTQLYERNETQLQMLNTLANRVDNLEKAFLCDKLKNRRKKKNKHVAAAFCFEE